MFLVQGTAGVLRAREMRYSSTRGEAGAFVLGRRHEVSRRNPEKPGCACARLLWRSSKPLQEDEQPQDVGIAHVGHAALLGRLRNSPSSS